MLFPPNPRQRNTDVRWLGVLGVLWSGCALDWVCSGLGAVCAWAGCGRALCWVCPELGVPWTGRCCWAVCAWAGCAYHRSLARVQHLPKDRTLISSSIALETSKVRNALAIRLRGAIHATSTLFFAVVPSAGHVPAVCAELGSPRALPRFSVERLLSAPVAADADFALAVASRSTVLFPSAMTPTCLYAATMRSIKGSTATHPRTHASGSVASSGIRSLASPRWAHKHDHAFRLALVQVHGETFAMARSR